MSFLTAIQSPVLETAQQAVVKTISDLHKKDQLLIVVFKETALMPPFLLVLIVLFALRFIAMASIILGSE